MPNEKDAYFDSLTVRNHVGHIIIPTHFHKIPRLPLLYAEEKAMPERRKIFESLTLDEAFSKVFSTVQTIQLRVNVELSIEEVIRPHEAKRIQYAFELVHGPRQPLLSRADERRDKYRHFLMQLKDGGLVGAVALGLGQTAIGNMKEAPRLRLPVKLKQRKQEFGSSFLASLASAFSKIDITSTGASPGEHVRSYHDHLSSNGMQPLPVTPISSANSALLLEDLSLSSETQQQNNSLSPGRERPPEVVQNSLRGRVFALTHEDVRTVAMSNHITGHVWMTDPYDNASFSFITMPITDEISLHFSTRRRRIM